MRKLLLRLFNLIYIAAAGVSIYFLATRPIIQTTAKINLSGEQVSKLLEPLLNKSSGGSGSSERAYTRAEEGEESSSSGDFSSYLTPDKVAEAFKDGIHHLDWRMSLLRRTSCEYCSSSTATPDTVNAIAGATMQRR